MKSPAIKTPWFGPVGAAFCRILCMPRLQGLMVGTFLAIVTIPIGLADAPTDRSLLPIEVLGADGAVESRSFTLQPGQAVFTHEIWLLAITLLENRLSQHYGISGSRMPTEQ